MRKSSLGRRSSTQIPVRVSNSGGSSAQRSASGGKHRGTLLKPGFTQNQRQRRSQSEDRESYGGRPLGSGQLKRSNSMSLGLSAMTPITPRQSIHSNLPTSSLRPVRSQTMSTDSSRRMSSFGGAKNVRKDTRPITEKPFQAAAQQKVQRYFEEYGSQVMSPGTSFRPMNTKLFVDMMDHLLKEFDSRIVITKSNYLEDLPTYLKGFGYRSKVDRSWLLTVNTAHSWPHVIAVLSWLVESIEVMNCIDPFEIMYQNVELEKEDVDDGDNIDAELIKHLKLMHRIDADPSKTFEEKEAMIEQMDSEFIEREIIEQKCSDEDFEVVQREIELTKEEENNEAYRRDVQFESLQSLRMKRNALLKDCHSAEQFIEDSEQFVKNNVATVRNIEEEIALKKSILSKKQEDFEKLQEKINCQKISMEEKENLNKEKHELHRSIQFHENSIRGYENSAFSVDMKFAEDQRKLDGVLLLYNNTVAEKLILENRLKNVEVKLAVLRKSEESALDMVENNLKSLKEEYRDVLLSFDTKIQEAENMLWRAKQDKKETEEEIAKETYQLEGVECDLEKQEKMIAKEVQKLKDECNHYTKLTKDIMDECSQFDSAKLQEKKTELGTLAHDYELLQKRTEIALADLSAQIRENALKLKEPLITLQKKDEELLKNHLSN